jgi:hypothetical protein
MLGYIKLQFDGDYLDEANVSSYYTFKSLLLNNGYEDRVDEIKDFLRNLII